MACLRCVGVRKLTQCCTKKRWKAHHDDTHEALGYNPCQLVPRKFHWTSNSSRQHFRPPFLWHKTMNHTGPLRCSERMTKGCLRTIPYPKSTVRGGFRGFVLFHNCSGEMIQFDEHNLSKEWRSRQLAQGLNTNFCKMLLRKNKSKMMLHYMYCKIYGASDKGCVTVMSWSKTLELYRITVAGQDECWNVNFTYGEVTET